MEFKDISRDNDPTPTSQCLILDTASKPSRLLLAKKYSTLPERYQKDFKHSFSETDQFFESLCEWSVEKTKTKMRASFPHPLVTICQARPEEHIPSYVTHAAVYKACN